MVLRTLVKFSAAKRVPLIKFRNGGNAQTSAPASATNQASSSSVTPKPKATPAPSSAIEDWELPSRYWRKPIEAEEMEYINRGGPA